MEKLLLVFRTIFIAGLVAGSTAAHAAEPMIFFSDLISAPKNGWDSSEPNKGAIVTIWGRNFGTQRGDSYVTVNGTKLTTDSDYKDVWAKTNNPVPFLQTITFQLNSDMSNGDGTISVSVNNTTSNTVPFRINTIGSIYFIDVNASGGTGTLSDPWDNPNDFIKAMSPGDVGYFRAGIYDKKYNRGKSNMWIRKTQTWGTPEDPIGFVGYPNEVAMFDSWTNGDKSSLNSSIKIESRYITVSKLFTRAFTRGIQVGRYGRIIGNDAIGVQEVIGGAGIIHTGSDGVKVLGNAVHGGRSGHRLDHSIYIDGCQELAANEIAYNYSYDNLIDRGPHFVDNHQVNRCKSDVYQKSNHWHNNLISCEADASRGIGIYDLSWDKGEANEPDPAYVYNNILIGCGDGWNGAMYHSNGHAVFYNNMLINNQGVGLQLHDNRDILSSAAINNVIINSTDDDYVQKSERHTFSNNSYFGGPADSIPSSDTNAVLTDPMITVDSTAYNPVIIHKDSPIIGKGSSLVSTLVTTDFFGTKQVGSYNIGSVGVGNVVIPPMAPSRPSQPSQPSIIITPPVK